MSLGKISVYKLPTVSYDDLERIIRDIRFINFIPSNYEDQKIYAKINITTREYETVTCVHNNGWFDDDESFVFYNEQSQDSKYSDKSFYFVDLKILASLNIKVILTKIFNINKELLQDKKIRLLKTVSFHQLTTAEIRKARSMNVLNAPKPLKEDEDVYEVVQDHIQSLSDYIDIEKFKEVEFNSNKLIIINDLSKIRGYRLPTINYYDLGRLYEYTGCNYYDENNYKKNKIYVKIDFRTGEYEEVTCRINYNNDDITFYNNDFDSSYLDREFIFVDLQDLEDINIRVTFNRFSNITKDLLQEKKKIPTLKELAMQQLSSEELRIARSLNILKSSKSLKEGENAYEEL